MSDTYQPKPVEQLTFTDDGMFQAVMHDPTVCSKIVEHLLHIQVDHIDFPELEKTIAPYYTSKGIRMDVYIKDSNRVIDVEMQARSRKALGKRTRYYQSMIDIDNLMKGEDYSMLRESYILFICKNDPFQDENKKQYGLPCYTFKTVCSENTDVNLDDKTTKVVYNASAYEKEEDEWIRRFLSYVYTGNSGEDDFANYLSAMVEKIKQDDNFRSLYLSMNLHDFDIREEAKEEGIQQGIQQGAQQQAIEDAIAFLKEKVPPEKVAKCVKLPVEKVLELQSQLSNTNS